MSELQQDIIDKQQAIITHQDTMIRDAREERDLAWEEVDRLINALRDGGRGVKV